MTRTEKLISISSEPLGAKISSQPDLLSNYAHGSELFRLLQAKNGFYAFEQALHVLPLQSDITGTMTMEEWNSGTLWRSGYDDLTAGLLFFAEDIFSDQFCLSAKAEGVHRFHAETAEIILFADSIEEWADLILSNYEVETGWPLAHEWQSKNGQLAFGLRLQPKIPFIYGGKYNLENLWAGDAVKGMLFKGEIALKVQDLPDGTHIRLQARDRE